MPLLHATSITRVGILYHGASVPHWPLLSKSRYSCEAVLRYLDLEAARPLLHGDVSKPERRNRSAVVRERRTLVAVKLGLSSALLPEKTGVTGSEIMQSYASVPRRQRVSVSGSVRRHGRRVRHHEPHPAGQHLRGGPARGRGLHPGHKWPGAYCCAAGLTGNKAAGPTLLASSTKSVSSSG